MHDLIIAGAGPAGLATALYAHRAGLKPVVVDPRAVPIDKACGEALSPSAVTALHGLDIVVRGHPIRGIRYLNRQNTAEAHLADRVGWGVRRTILASSMYQSLAEREIPIVQGRVTDVRQNAWGVTAAGFAARYLVAADGLHSPIRKTMGLDMPFPGAARRWGLRRHFPIRPWTDMVEVHWSDHAEAFVTPVDDKLVGVAVLFDRPGSFQDQLSAFPSLAERLTIDPATDVRGAGPMRQRSRRRVAGRVLLVGDAAGYIDALTAEGIAVALRCARTLVECITDDQPGRYEREWLRQTRRCRASTSSLLWVSRRSCLRRNLVPAAERAPAIFTAIVRHAFA